MLLEPHQHKIFDFAFKSQPLGVAERELDKINRLLDAKESVDAFAIAWDETDYDVRAAVLFLCYRKYAQYFRNGSRLGPDSKAADFDVSQRNACWKFLVKLGDQTPRAAGHMNAARELAEGYADSRRGRVA